MEGETQQTRHETYERIPWETLQAPRGDRQWILYVVAGALVVGAFGYSFVSNRTSAPTPAPAVEPVAVPPTVPSSEPVQAQVPAPVTPPPAPVVASEADLYAVHPERRLDQALAHAEWFASEYFTVDGSPVSADSLAALLPIGIPQPARDGETLVFVESARAVGVEELDGLTYRVEVLVRWLKAEDDGVYERQPATMLLVDVEVGEEGAKVVMPPQIVDIRTAPQASPALVEVPTDVAAMAVEQTGGSEVIGGVAGADGRWQVVVMAPGPDGIVRPQTVVIG